MVVNCNNWVFICIYLNSVVDLYVEMLDEYFNEESGIIVCKFLRIYIFMCKLFIVFEKVR